MSGLHHVVENSASPSSFPPDYIVLMIEQLFSNKNKVNCKEECETIFSLDYIDRANKHSVFRIADEKVHGVRNKWRL